MCNKQRVLIVHNYYQVPGGEDSVVANEKKMLEDHGHEVFMYTRHNDEIKKMGLLKKLMIPFNTIYNFKTKRDIEKIVRENNIDIVHVHNTLPLISPSVYVGAKKAGAKVVQTIHNFRLLCPAATFVKDNKICEDCINKSLICAIKGRCYRNSLIQTIICVLMLKINRIIGSYDKVDNYIALTDFNKDKLKKIIDEDKIIIKPNFIKDNSNVKIKNEDERKYFMFLGRLDKLKGIDKLIIAWKEIRNEELIVVGKGPEEEKIKKYINENQINNVKLLGFKEKKDVMELLSYAKALIVPSQWYEGFPMTIVEALSVGTPVITTDIGNIKAVGETSLGTLPNENFNSWSTEIIRNNNKQIISKAINNARSLFDKKYTEEINYQIIKKIYNFRK